ncbi:hypothetical protein MATL_G00017710 [Megalops atlanticus]|uniref:Interferon-induced protein with tetratricopeptide repeats 5 n=1 Tax=Megalops atlanticus TaxID=7932 RepID=A0A9D3QIF2_MEGAT|nr:hypothetical protein MATL_G00017710 [Megalops atlanticus]
MSVSDKADLEAKMRKLECPFTWDINKDDINDLDNIPEKLLDRVKFCPRKYHATYLNILAFVSHLMGNNESALEFLLRAETLLKADRKAETEFLVTCSNLAWVYYQSGNLSDVETYLGKLEKICKGIPGSSQYSCCLPVIHGEKAWTFLRLGATFYERAKDSFQKALEGDPDNASFNVGYAVVLYRLEGMDRDKRVRPEASEAVAQLRKALLLDPTDAEAMVLLALKLHNSRKHESMKLIEDALQLSPDVPQVTRYVAKYFRAEGSLDTSLDILRRAVQLAPNSSFLHHQIGLCLKQQLARMFQTKRGAGRVPATLKRAKAAECIHHFSKAAELKPTNIHARVNLAEAYGENHQLDEAEKIFTDLLQDGSLRDSDKQHCHTSYGAFLLYKRKAEDCAIAEFKTAYRMQIQSLDRKQAGKKLRQIAEKRLNTKQRVGEAFEILAFLSTEDKQERQAEEYTRRARQYFAEMGDLPAAFEKGMKLK